MFIKKILTPEVSEIFNFLLNTKKITHESVKVTLESKHERVEFKSFEIMEWADFIINCEMTQSFEQQFSEMPKAIFNIIENIIEFDPFLIGKF